MSANNVEQEVHYIKTQVTDLYTRVSALEIGASLKEETLKEIRQDQKEMGKKVQQINDKLITEIANMNGVLRGILFSFKVGAGLVILSLGSIAMMAVKIWLQ